MQQVLFQANYSWDGKLVNLSSIINKPCISIITCTFNDCELLKITIDKISTLNYPNYEYIVVDGGSTDSTLNLLSRSQSIVTRWISEPDQGIYDAWNKGVFLAKGDYIAFLGAGDFYVDNGLDALVNAAISQSEAEFICGKVLIIGDGKAKRIIGKEWSWNHFRRYMCTTHVGALHSRKLFHRYGFFNANYKIAGDYEFLLRAKENLKSTFVNQIVCSMQEGGISQRNFQVLREVKNAKWTHQCVNYFQLQSDYVKAYLKLFIRNNFLS